MKILVIEDEVKAAAYIRKQCAALVIAHRFDVHAGRSGQLPDCP